MNLLAKSSELFTLSRQTVPMLKRTSTITAAVALVALATLTQFSQATATRGVVTANDPTLQRPAVAAKVLVDNYFTALMDNDDAALRDMIAMDFVHGINGGFQARKAFVNVTRYVTDFEVTRVAARQTAGTLTINALVALEGGVGNYMYSTAPSQQMIVATWTGSRWLITSHSNLNRTVEIPAASPEVLLNAVSETVLSQTVAYPSDSQAQISSSIITLMPGQSTPSHRHDAPMFGFILSGELEVSYDGGFTKRLSTGEALVEAIGTYHAGTNVSKVPCKILVVNIGAEGVLNTALEPTPVRF